MTSERAQVLWDGICQSIAQNGTIIMPPTILEELREAGLYKEGELDTKALHALARAGRPASIRQHIPPFVDGVDPKKGTFRSLPELLQVPWVAAWTDDPNFHRFSVSDRTRLMAEFDGGKVWWVVGFLSEVPDGLPVWEPKDKDPP